MGLPCRHVIALVKEVQPYHCDFRWNKELFHYQRIDNVTLMVEQFMKLRPMQGPEVTSDDIQNYLATSVGTSFPCIISGTANPSDFQVQDESTSRKENDKNAMNCLLGVGGLSQEVTFANDLSFPSHDGPDSYAANFSIFKECAMIADCDAELFQEMRDDMRRMYDKLNSKLRSKRNAAMLDESLNLMSSNLPLPTHQSMKKCKRKKCFFEKVQNHGE